MKKINLLIVTLYLNLIGLIAFTITVIAYIILALSNNDSEKANNYMEVFSTMFFVWIVVYVLIAVVNVVSGVIEYRRREFGLIFSKMKRLKTALIPYWIINFICYLPICVFLLIFGHGFGFVVVPVIILSSYSVLLVTSVFSILFLMYLKKTNKIEMKEFILHTILQLVFVLDVIDAFILMKRYKEHKYI